MQKFGSLWGLPGVVEQPIRRGKETALIFPIPTQVEVAVSQVSLTTPTAFCASSSRTHATVVPSFVLHLIPQDNLCNKREQLMHRVELS